MILGAGETSELTARALSEQGAGTIFVANRHADRALSLAQRFGGSVVGLDRLPDQLVQADIVLSSTSSPHPIVGREELELVMAERGERRRPLLLIDIAVPRDVDPACGELDGVTLYDIDDLQAVVARNLSTRAEETPRALEIVEEEIQRFARWLGQLDALPTISALRAHGDSHRRAGARRELRALGVRLRARPRARGGDRARGHEPPAARADDPPAQPQRRSRPREPRARARAVRAARGRGRAPRGAAARRRPAELAEVHDLRQRRSSPGGSSPR